MAIANQWARDDSDIAGAPTSIYTAFATGAYRCRVTASSPGGVTPLTSAPHTVSAPVATGPGNTTAPPPAAAPAPAPARLAGARSPITVDRGGRFAFTLFATEALTGRATIDSAAKVRVSRRTNGRKRVALARESFVVGPGGKVTLTIRLSRTNRRILRLNRRISTQVTVTLENAAGMTTRSSRKITLESAKPPSGLEPLT